MLVPMSEEREVNPKSGINEIQFQLNNFDISKLSDFQGDISEISFISSGFLKNLERK